MLARVSDHELTQPPLPALAELGLSLQGQLVHCLSPSRRRPGNPATLPGITWLQEREPGLAERQGAARFR
jgi:hypothetical protein